jgi:Lhr-like helicase
MLRDYDTKKARVKELETGDCFILIGRVYKVVKKDDNKILYAAFFNNSKASNNMTFGAKSMQIVDKIICPR